MSVETQELIHICERLPEAKRIEVVEFARFLLAKNEDAMAQETMARWLATARGPAKRGGTTDEIMQLTRGEP